MVTNMIRQLQESIPSGAWPVLLKKWLRGAKTVQLPLTFSMSCQVFTLILFPRLMNIEEDLPKAMLKNSANNKKDILRLKISQMEKNPQTELGSYLSQFVLAAKIYTGKDYERSSLRGIWLKCWTPFESLQLRQNYLQTQWFQKKKRKTKKRVESETKATQTTWNRKQTKKPQRLLRTTKLRLFSTRSCFD